ncbi:putative transmembrane protein TauE [Helianthus annuus]|nr:putative transmembrane protein TauE [Helianthus annuus]
MATRPFAFFLFFLFSIVTLTVYILTAHIYDHQPFLRSSPNSLFLKPQDKIWPEFEFNWRLLLATVIGFFGSAFGTVGGVGGGGIFVPMLTLIVGFDTKSAAALSKCMFSVFVLIMLIELVKPRTGVLLICFLIDIC